MAGAVRVRWAEDARRQLGVLLIVFLLAGLMPSVPARAAGDPLDEWTDVHEWASSLMDVAYLNGGYIAVGDSGRLLTSTDGVDWSNQDAGSDSLYGVAFGNGRYVAVGYYGTILTSTDGSAWTLHDRADTEIPHVYLYSVEFLNDRFIAVGDGAVILTSPDGLIWTRQEDIPEDTGESLHGVAYGNGTYVAVGEYSLALTSTDAIHWTRQVTGVASRGVVYANGLFVTVGENGDIATSNDGASWTERTIPGGNSLFGIGYGAGMYVVAGANGTILTSPDGTDWTSRDSGETESLFEIAYHEGTFTVVGASGVTLLSGNVPHVTKIVAGELFAHAVRSDGTVWGWGANDYGQLCNGANDDQCLPVEVSNLAGLTKLFGAFGNGYAVNPDGTVASWGMNYDGELGNGSATSMKSNVPVSVSDLTGITDVFGGYETVYALADDHTLWAWGEGSWGQLGNNTSDDAFVPAHVLALDDVVAAAGGWWNGYALNSDGTVHAWGANYQGQLGSDQSFDTYWYAPQQIPTLSDVIAVAARGFSAYALTSDGDVYAWGNNDHGQVGDAPITGAFAPVLVAGLSDVKAITSGHWSAYALKSDGTVWAWGYNAYGQLGDGTTNDSSTPLRVAGLTDVVAISGGQFTCYALKSDGSVWAWGDNQRGQLGNDSTARSSVPVQVGIPAATVAEPSNDANLDGLALQGDDIIRLLTPDFSPDITEYTTVANNTIQVMPTTDANATITVNGSAVTSGDWSEPITLTAGRNVIEVEVTAEDGVTTKTYTVTVATGLAIETPADLPAGAVGTPYSTTLEASGGFSPYVWSVELPPGLSLNTTTGGITGTPTTADHYSLSVTVSDDIGLTASKTMEMDITGSTEGDTTPPAWAPTYPHAELIGDLRCWLGLQGNEPGTAYWVLLPHGATAPSTSQVANGQNHDGDSVPHGERSFIATGESITRVTGLAPDTVYDIYVVAKDLVANWQSEPTMVEVLTSYPDDGQSGITSQIKGANGSKRVTLTLTVKTAAGVSCPGHPLSHFSVTIDGVPVNLAEDPHFSGFVDNDDGTYTIVFTGNADGTGYAFTNLMVGETLIEAGPTTVTTPPAQVAPPYTPPQAPPAPQAQLLASSGSPCGSVPVTTTNGTATATIGQSNLNSAFAASSADADGVTTVDVSIPEIDGANGYESVLPAAFLASGDDTEAIEIQTVLGSVTVPGNMLPTGTTGNASLRIGVGDKSKLSAELQAGIGDRPVVNLSLKINGVTTPWSNDAAPVQVSIPYTPTAAELADPDHITVWYIDGAGNAVAVPSGHYDPATGTVVFTVTHFSQYAVVCVETTFSDLSGYGWAEKEIEALAARGIIRGITDDAFFPGNSITRADYTVLLMRTLGLTAEVSGNFADVHTQDYYYTAVGIAKKLGIATGTGENLFRPGDPISRQDMAVLTARALESMSLLKPGATTALDGFSDQADIAGYAAGSLAALVQAGLIRGIGGAVEPTALTTRAEAAVLLYRIYALCQR